MTQNPGQPKPETRKVEVDMSLRDKVHEFLEPILGDKLQYKPIFDGALSLLFYGSLTLAVSTLGLVPPIGGLDLTTSSIICTAIGSALGAAIFDIRYFKGKRSQHNVK